MNTNMLHSRKRSSVLSMCLLKTDWGYVQFSIYPMLNIGFSNITKLSFSVATAVVLKLC